MKYLILVFSFMELLFFHVNTFAQVPHLKVNGSATQLIVDGKPYIILGGELHNSTSSSLEFLQDKWKQLKLMNLNTVLAVVSWQQTEPEEGKFDFTLVDGLLQMARENEMKLALLWFGSWKNGLSHYVPSWVKKDQERFPRIRLNNGKATETITPLSVEAKKADSRAFTAFMAHIKKVDSKERTVIMVQVQNEVGVLGASRDHSDAANDLFLEEVPQELINGLKEYRNELQLELKTNWAKTGNKENGNWREIFGDNTFADEAFMAWHYATYINSIAKAGKMEYNLPMFVNAWIVQPEDVKPGDYPAGGPQSHVLDIWRIAAPQIDLKCPDIYLPDFPGITAMYHHDWNPLFIPESFSGLRGASNVFFALGSRKAVGYSPFGIDNPIKNPSESPLAKAYDVINQLMPEITEAQANDKIVSFFLTQEDDNQVIGFGGYKIHAALSRNRRSGEVITDRGYGIIIQKNKNEFIVAGADATVTFVPDSPEGSMAGFEYIYEGNYIDGNWKPGRLLNGDNVMINYDLANQAIQNKTGSAVRLGKEPEILKVKLYHFE